MQTRKLSKPTPATVQQSPMAGTGDGDRPSEQAIRERAHQFYLSRLGAGQNGNEITDWLQAERELNERFFNKARLGAH